MNKNEILSELEDIFHKYERLQSLIEIIQMFVAEVAEIESTHSNSLSNALIEIELEMGENNDKLGNLLFGERRCGVKELLEMQVVKH